MTNLLASLEKVRNDIIPLVADKRALAAIISTSDDPFNDKSPNKENRHSPFIHTKNISRDRNQDPANTTAIEEPVAESSCKTVEIQHQEPPKAVSTKSTKKPKKTDEVEDDEVPLSVLEEMSKLEECFPELSSNYRLIDKIGEGTFSSVYKAEALNGIVKLDSEMWKSPPLKRHKSTKKKALKNPIVALKQIYVTSSPNRIYNELNLLYILTGHANIAPLLDVLRFQDQVVAILPYYPHADFRDFYRDLPVKGIKKYLWELFQGLEFVHNKGVIHRDLKQTNFLYDPFRGKGVLVDFGLAEKVTTAKNLSNVCPCDSKEKVVLNRSHNKRLNVKAAYPKQDQRPPRRANRAGTRGFRAPEVLFKCTNQSTKIDIWSAGIIGLSLLARKFPFFNSPDDTDALVELAEVFGVSKLQKCAELHGCGLEMHLNPTTGEFTRGNVLNMILVSLEHERDSGCLPANSVIYDTLSLLQGEAFVEPSPTHEDYDRMLACYEDHVNLYDLLMGCLHMDPSKRLSAKQILKLPVFSELHQNQDDDVIL